MYAESCRLQDVTRVSAADHECALAALVSGCQGQQRQHEQAAVHWAETTTVAPRIGRSHYRAVKANMSIMSPFVVGAQPLLPQALPRGSGVRADTKGCVVCFPWHKDQVDQTELLG